MSITAVLSTFNNEVTISNVVLQTLAHADRVIVVDDGSTDNTAEKARLAGAEVIRHNINMGKEAVLRTGFALAAQNGAKVIVTMDSGGRHDPADIRKFTIAAMPAFNEERSIAKMVLLSRKYADKVVVVDDGSTDSTADIAEAMGAHVIRHPKNRGYGGALQTCFATARDLAADRMVILDSDGQHDPADIPKLVEPLNEGFDVVIGSRFINGNGKNIPFYRKVGMKVLDTHWSSFKTTIPL